MKTLGCNGMLKLMEGNNNRNAEFQAVAALLLDGDVFILEVFVKASSLQKQAERMVSDSIQSLYQTISSEKASFRRRTA